jgi:hypothetical protein
MTHFNPRDRQTHPVNRVQVLGEAATITATGTQPTSDQVDAIELHTVLKNQARPVDGRNRY